MRQEAMERTFIVLRIDHQGNVWGRNIQLPHDNQEFLGHFEELPGVMPGQPLVLKSEPFDLATLDN